LDCRPERLKAACDASLRALGVASIALFQLHGVDPRVDYQDSVGALWELKQAGKIQHIGLSNVDQVQLRQACAIVNVASVQNRCNIYERHCFANGVVDFCERRGIAFIAHSPLGGHKRQDRMAGDVVLRKVAARHNVTPHQVALAWLLRSSPNLLAVPGASRKSSALSSVSAAALTQQLRQEDWADLDRAYPRAGFLLSQLVAARREGRHVLRRVKRRLRGAPRLDRETPA
jgi:aryl-alcohol dehydrogenase-like predicted oxidoreductase